MGDSPTVSSSLEAFCVEGDTSCGRLSTYYGGGGGMVDRAYGKDKNMSISRFVLAIFGPIHCYGRPLEEGRFTAGHSNSKYHQLNSRSMVCTAGPIHYDGPPE